MELPQIGKQCHDTTCKQLDFLPFTCKCQTIFCSEHYNLHIQMCPAIQTFKDVEIKNIENVFTCSHVDCKETSILPLICEKCKNHYCIQHRHIIECFKEDPHTRAALIEKMNAPIKLFNDAKAIVDKQLDATLVNAKRRNRNIETANKIQLMRVKNKATGLKIIPAIDRVYLNIQHPKDTNEKCTAVFVSKVWSIGKIIDIIAEECKVKNNNNQLNEKKLRLFRKSDGKILSNSMADKMEDLLINKFIIDGDNLILEYVVDDCTNLNY